jgi:hypothetical protein
MYLIVRSTPFRGALGYPVDSCSTSPPLKDLMHVLMRREIEPLFYNTVSGPFGICQRRSELPSAD